MQTPVRKVTNQTPLQVPRASADQFGGQEARAVQQLGDAVQSVSADAEAILQKHDTYAAQKAYNTVQEQAFNGQKDNLGKPIDFGYNDHLNRKGEQAFNSPQEFEAYLDKIKADTIKNLSPRQQRLFLQNWEPKEFALKQRVANHATGQIEAAQINEMGVLVDSQLQEIVASTGIDVTSEAWAQAENTFRTWKKRQGFTKDAIDMDWEKTKEATVTRQFDTLLKAGEFDSAEILIGIEAGAEPTPKQQVMQNLVEDARQSKIDREFQAKVRADQQGEYAVQEDVLINGKNDPFYHAPLKLYVQKFGVEEGEARYLRDVAEMDALRKKAEGQQLDPQYFELAVKMSKRPQDYTYEERMQMSYVLRTSKDPGLSGLVSQLEKTFSEQAKNGFVSPETNLRNSHLIRIYTLFDKANRKGRNTFDDAGALKGDDRPGMTTSGTVIAAGESADALVEAFQLYDKTLAAAEKKGLDPWATQELLDKVVFTPLQRSADEGFLREKEGFNSWINSGDQALRALAGEPKKDEEAGLLLAEDTSEEDAAWLNAVLNGGTDVPSP